MPDSRFPMPVAGETNGLPRRAGLRLSDAGAIAATRPERHEGASSEEGPPPDGAAPSKAEQLATEPMRGLNTEAPPPALEAAFDDAQPMLDLRFPEEESQALTADGPDVDQNASSEAADRSGADPEP